MLMYDVDHKTHFSRECDGHRTRNLEEGRSFVVELVQYL